MEPSLQSDTSRLTGPSKISRREFLRYLGVAFITSACGQGQASNSTDTQPPTTAQDSSTSLTTTGASTADSTVAQTSTTTPSVSTTLAPPALEITFPPDEAWFCGESSFSDPECEIMGPRLTFEGTVTPGAQVFHRDQQADVSDGTWSIRIQLIPDGEPVAEGGFPGLETEPKDYIFVARNPDGQEDSKTVRVRYSEFEPSDR